MREPNDHTGQAVEASNIIDQAQQEALTPSPATPPGAPPLALAGTLATSLACGLACLRAKAPPAPLPGTPPGVQKQLTKIACERGFTPVQINILGILLRWQHKVLSHASISAELFTSYGMTYSPQSVKEVVARLKKRNIIRSWQAREGMIQGSQYNIVGDSLCPHINAPYMGIPPGAPAHTTPGVHPEPGANNTILEQVGRIIRPNSSSEERSTHLLEALTEDDLAFHWPNLAKHDFGTVQIRTVISRLAQVGISTQRVLEGLNRAEWELARHGCLHDWKGSLVHSPRGYVFDKLAREGSYPRPQGYSSQQEEAEREATKQATAYKAALEERFNAEFELWQLSLTSDELKQIPLPTSGTSSDPARAVFLKRHFRECEWPKILSSRSSPQPNSLDHVQLSPSDKQEPWPQTQHLAEEKEQ